MRNLKTLVFVPVGIIAVCLGFSACGASIYGGAGFSDEGRPNSFTFGASFPKTEKLPAAEGLRK